ncbi:DUF4142 domain-containing protein [Teichococcus oryzae]|nr:DUF4142 domain-containing protein [Pseudoroseomonas oryzae]
MAPAATRRAFLLLGAGAAFASGAATAQDTGDPVDPAHFLAFAYSSALLQQRASALTASRDTRPEAREYAGGMARFREQQLARLRSLAGERGVTLPGDAEFEHRVVLENLEPLDFLALSRRYAEIQIQALTQEIRGYEAAEKAPDEGLKQLAAEMLPQLRQRLEAANRMHDAVKP